MLRRRVLWEVDVLRRRPEGHVHGPRRQRQLRLLREQVQRRGLFVSIDVPSRHDAERELLGSTRASDNSLRVHALTLTI